MSNLQEMLDQLKCIISARRDGYVREADRLIVEIVRDMDPDALHGLLRTFDDNASHDLMFSIIHAVEAWPDPCYSNALVEAIPYLWEQSPYWAQILHIRVLNAPSTLSSYLQAIEPKDRYIKDNALRIFRSIVRYHPPLAERTLAAIQLLE